MRTRADATKGKRRPGRGFPIRDSAALNARRVPDPSYDSGFRTAVSAASLALASSHSIGRGARTRARASIRPCGHRNDLQAFFDRVGVSTRSWHSPPGSTRSSCLHGPPQGVSPSSRRSQTRPRSVISPVVRDTATHGDTRHHRNDGRDHGDAGRRPISASRLPTARGCRACRTAAARYRRRPRASGHRCRRRDRLLHDVAGAPVTWPLPGIIAPSMVSSSPPTSVQARPVTTPTRSFSSISPYRYFGTPR